jgi:hypothetical protein
LTKRLFWCIHNYGTGEVLIRIAARSPSDIRGKYPQLDVVEGVPHWFSSERDEELEKYPEYDIDEEPRGALKELDVISEVGESKRHYYAEYRAGGELVRRRIWARSLFDIEERYPQLDVVPMVVAPAEAWSAAGCDIDSPDPFLSRLLSKHS